MAKFRGVIGFVTTEETAPGVYNEIPTEYNYSGDILRDARNIAKGEGVNSTVSLSNRISIISNDFALSNLRYMRYIKWLDQKWKILSVEIQRPRIIITVGGLYNG